MPLKLSIIIPALNEGEGIAKAVERAWAAGPHEVIVVDGGSQDDTAAIARARGAKVYTSPPPRARQQNHAARQATGDVLLFLHADNWLEPQGVDQIAAALTNRSVLGGAFRQRIDARGVCYRLLERGNGLRVRALQMAYGDQGIFLRRETFEHLGGFPEVALMEDVLLMQRFRALSRPVLLPGPLHVSPRRWQRHGVVRQTLRNWALLMAARLGVSPDRLARFYPPHTPSA